MLQEAHLVFRKPPRLTQLLDNNTGKNSSGRIATRGPGLAFPCAKDGSVHIETCYRLVKVAHKSAAPQLAVREDLETKLLLAREHALDVPVLNSLELFWSNVWILAGVEYFLWPQKATDVVRAIFKRH